MTKRLKDKVAVVTGSGRGIGRAIAMAMAHEGAKLIINDLGCQADGTGSSISVADKAVNDINSRGGIAIANHESVATSNGAESAINSAIEHFGRIDILINNAGIIRDRILWEMTDKAWDAVMKTNLYGHFYCTRTAVIHMKKSIKAGKQNAGKIINITSHAGIKGGPIFPAYSAAKMGIVGFTYSCALALWKEGITCNAVAPHAMTRFVDTLTNNALRKMAATRGIKDAMTLPLNEVKENLFGPPDVIAPLICWLSSEKADNINGQVFFVRQGRIGLFCPMEETKVIYSDDVFDLHNIWQIMPILTDGLSNPAIN